MTTLDMATLVPLSRRTLFKGASATGLGLALAQAGAWQPAAAQGQGEELQDILNITATTEAFGVTALGGAIASAEAGNYDQPIPEPVLAILRAARAQEQFHLDFFLGAGGELLTDTFTVPPELLTNYTAFFSALVDLEARETAAQIAAMTTFTQLNRPDLVKASFQYAAEESEHRVLANYALGTRPPNDNAFAPALYTSVAEHLAFLEESGLIGGSGTAVTYPGPGEIDATGVTNTEPDGPAVDCAPADLVEAGVGGGEVAQIAEGQDGGDDGRGGGGRTGGDDGGDDGGGRGGRGGGRQDGQVNGMPAVGVGSAYGAAGATGAWAMLGLAGAAGAAAIAMRTRRLGLLAADEGGERAETDA